MAFCNAGFKGWLPLFLCCNISLNEVSIPVGRLVAVAVPPGADLLAAEPWPRESKEDNNWTLFPSGAGGGGGGAPGFAVEEFAGAVVEPGSTLFPKAAAGFGVAVRAVNEAAAATAAAALLVAAPLAF